MKKILHNRIRCKFCGDVIESMEETVWVLYYEEPIHGIIGCYLFRTEEACKEFKEKTKYLFDVIHYEELPIYSNYKEYEENANE